MISIATISLSDALTLSLASLVIYVRTHFLFRRTLEKLTTEIRTTFTSLNDIKSGKQLQSCLYLWASIDEALRMNPHGGSESHREVLPGGIRIKDDLLPPGSIIGGDVYTIHHNPEIFPGPFRFRPGRWIVGNGVTAEDVKAREGAVFAFSYDVRSLPGKGLARMELAVAMARLIFQYDFRGVPGDTEGQGNLEIGWGRRQKTQFQVWDYMVAYRNGPMVQFRERAT